MTTQATALRDAICERLASLPGYKPIRKTPIPILQPNQLPALSVFITNESLSPDGDDNAGDIRFESDITIAVSVVRGFDDEVVLSGQIDADVDAIENTLLTDGTFTEFRSRLFEAIPRMRRSRLYPQSGETYFAELRLEITFRVRAAYEPVITDDLRKVVMTERPYGSADTTPPVTVEVDLPAP